MASDYANKVIFVFCFYEGERAVNLGWVYIVYSSRQWSLKPARQWFSKLGAERNPSWSILSDGWSWGSATAQNGSSGEILRDGRGGIYIYAGIKCHMFLNHFYTRTYTYTHVRKYMSARCMHYCEIVIVSYKEIDYIYIRDGNKR